MKEKINSYLKASKKGSDWLVSKQKDDGSITNVEAYYKAPYVLGITGRIPEANKLINWIKTDVMKDNGDLNHNTIRIAGLLKAFIAWVALMFHYQQLDIS